MKSLLSTSAIPAIFLFTIIALVLVLLLTFYVEKAKKKTGLNFIYMLVGGLFIGIVGIRASAINNPFYFYLVVLCWNLISGTIHFFLGDKILGWTKTEAIGWRLVYSLAIVFTGFAGLLAFMQLVDYNFLVMYNLSAVLTFFIPLTLVYAIECYMLIPQKVYLQQKPWIYNRSSDLVFKSDEISHFFLIKYRLAVQTGGESIESLSMRAPGNIKLGDYFNSTLEVNKVTQGRHSIEARDRSNNSLGWFFFLSDGSATGKMLDPNKTFIELGFTNPVYFGNSNPEAIETITRQAEAEGKNYLINCTRELEYKSQLMKA
jgi:hypothetical protein